MPTFLHRCVVGTGTRQLINNKGIYNYVKQQLILLLFSLTIFDDETIPFTYGISGGAEGFDELLSEVYNECGIQQTILIPNMTYGDYYWKKNSVTGKDRYNEFAELVQKFDTEILFNSVYVNGKHSNLLRNINMINRACNISESASKVIGIVYNPNSKSRGTMHCHNEMKKKKLTIYQWNDDKNTFVQDKY